jgi:hypothetical protein
LKHAEALRNLWIAFPGLAALNLAAATVANVGLPERCPGNAIVLAMDVQDGRY